MNLPLHSNNDLSRRNLMLATAKTALGVSILSLNDRLNAADAEPSPTSGPGFGKAKSVIYLYMSGAMSHIDTLDPKTGATKGPKDAVKAKGDNINQLGGYLPEMAKISDKITVVRSMASKTGVHEFAQYIMRTGYEKRNTIVHPEIGAWATHFKGKISDSLPDSVVIGRGDAYPGSGFFPAALSPLPIPAPERGVSNLKTTTSEDVFNKRLSMMNQLDAEFRTRFNFESVNSYTQFYDETIKFMKSKDLDVFDISKEKNEMRESYGSSPFGQGCLLARRLVERGVGYIEVSYGGWDMHNELESGLDEKTPALDKAYSALIKDLEAKGLLQSTLVVLGTDFGRTPDINRNDGRDHYPKAYSAVFAGASVKKGFAYGSTDAEGREVTENPVSPEDFISTIGYSMGLPINDVVMSPSNRPFTIGNTGKVVTGIFS